MTAQRLVFIESNTTGTGRLFAAAARAEGCAPVLLARNPDLYPFAREEAVPIIEADTGSAAALLDLCRKISDEAAIAGITSTSDYYVSIAAELAARLGLPGPSIDSITTCRDKERQYACLSARGVRIPATRAAVDGRGAVSAARELGFPVVVKPVGGSGSVGVRLCGSEQEVEERSEHLLAQTVNERGMPVRRLVLVQEFVDGPEFSVESLAGHVIGITRKYVSKPPVFVEIGHDFPARLPAADELTIADAVRRALDALDLNWGAAHTELKLSRNGPTIIEVNPRLAGGFIPELVRRSTGIDLVKLLTRRILGRDVDLQPSSSGFASIRFVLPPRSGTLLGVSGLDDLPGAEELCEVSVYRPPGSEIVLAGDFHDRIGHVISSSEDPDMARSIAERAVDSLKVGLR
jgi:argininosuccinate lyase